MCMRWRLWSCKKTNEANKPFCVVSCVWFCVCFACAYVCASCTCASYRMCFSFTTRTETLLDGASKCTISRAPHTAAPFSWWPRSRESPPSKRSSTAACGMHRPTAWRCGRPWVPWAAAAQNMEMKLKICVANKFVGLEQQLILWLDWSAWMMDISKPVGQWKCTLDGSVSGKQRRRFSRM